MIIVLYMKIINFFILLIGTINASRLQSALDCTWQGLKNRNIDPYQVKLVHRPYSEEPGDAVSEGVGYGMLVALYSNDQKYFNLIWEAAEQYMWNGQYYDWRVDIYGNKIAYGSATDAESDIAASLIFAQRLVNNGKWIEHIYPSYGERAQNILDNMWNSRMISYGNNVAPGGGWGGDDFVNPGYFAPAWYRIFSEVDTSNHDWNSVIDHCYNIILNNVGFKNGLIPDWTSSTGDYYYGSLGYNAYGNGKYFFKDAIRILWRISTDYLWNKDIRAEQFLTNSYNFIEGKGGAINCNFFTMDGELLPHDDVWYFDNGQKSRSRREHSHLTIGMWSTVPFALAANNTFSYENELLKYYENSDYWGLSTDSSGLSEDINHNEMYFDQFLAWFGAIILNGTWVAY